MATLIALLILLYTRFICIPSAWSLVILPCRCPPGTYLVSNCNTTHAVVCNQCLPGETYMDTYNTNPKCQKCTVCSRGRILKEKCTSTKDTVCSCEEADEFYDIMSDYCTTCAKCQAGEGIVKDCTYSANRQCSPCKLGVTFSSQLNMRCQPCSQCKVGERVIRNCLEQNDTLCEKVFRPVNNGSRYFIVISVIIVSAGILTLIVVVLWRWWKPRCPLILFPGTRQRKVLLANGNGEAHELRSNRAGQTARLQKTSSASCSANSPLMQAEPKKINDIKYEIIENLALKLNPKSKRDWRLLASHLGYTNDQILCLKADPLQATQNLIRDFATKKDATVDKLYRCLVAIGRKEAADLLLPFVSSEELIA